MVILLLQIEFIIFLFSWGHWLCNLGHECWWVYLLIFKVHICAILLNRALEYLCCTVFVTPLNRHYLSLSLRAFERVLIVAWKLGKHAAIVFQILVDRLAHGLILVIWLISLNVPRLVVWLNIAWCCLAWIHIVVSGEYKAAGIWDTTHCMLWNSWSSNWVSAAPILLNKFMWWTVLLSHNFACWGHAWVDVSLRVLSRILLDFAIVTCGAFSAPINFLLAMSTLNKLDTGLLLSKVSQTERMACLYVKSAYLRTLGHGNCIFFGGIFFRNCLQLAIYAFQSVLIWGLHVIYVGGFGACNMGLIIASSSQGEYLCYLLTGI